MNTQRGWFAVIGLAIVLLLGVGVYFLWPTAKSINAAPSTTATANTLVPPPTPAATLPTSTPDTASPTQPQASPSPAPEYLYNAQGQLQSITYPDGTVYAYQYNAHGDKIRETNSKTGKTWSYTY